MSWWCILRKIYVMFSYSSHLGSAILDVLIFSKTTKKLQNWPKIIKINEWTQKLSNMLKLLQSSYNFPLKRGKFRILKKKFLWKSGCHNNIKLDGPRLAMPNCSQKIFRKRFSGFGLLIEKLETSKFRRVESPPFPFGLNRVNSPQLKSLLIQSHLYLA